MTPVVCLFRMKAVTNPRRQPNQNNNQVPQRWGPCHVDLPPPQQTLVGLLITHVSVEEKTSGFPTLIGLGRCLPKFCILFIYCGFLQIVDCGHFWACYVENGPHISCLQELINMNGRVHLKVSRNNIQLHVSFDNVNTTLNYVYV